MRAAAIGLLVVACTDPHEPAVAPPPDAAPTPSRHGFHAAPSGTARGDGSRARPWDLPTALDGGPGRPGPGDTLWLHEGTYSGGVVSTLTGAPGRPVVIRAFPGERAIINGAGVDRSTFVVRGDWAVYWGLELTNTVPDRTRDRPDVVYNRASHVRYVNLVIHDGGVGFYTDPEALDIEIAGCVLYNNGWEEPDRGHGHGIYLKSDVGPVHARGNVVFNQFGYGIHAYSDAGSGGLNNLSLEDNIAFNNGVLVDPATASNILVGGYEPSDGLVVRDNVTFFPSEAATTNVELGYDTLTNGAMVVSENTFVGGAPVLRVRRWFAAAVSANLLVGSHLLVELADTSRPVLQVWGGNRHVGDAGEAAWAFGGLAYAFPAWQDATGLAGTDDATSGPPSAPDVIIVPDRYESGRAFVAVVNWTRQPMVALDLSAVLAVGDAYEIRNVQDLFGSPVRSGVQTGDPVTVLMVGVQPPTPVGLPASPAPVTAPAFDVFLVTRTAR